MKISTGLLAAFLKIGSKMLSVIGKLAKSAKVVKVGLGVSSAAAYTMLYSWEFAASIMLMVFVHESGHIWAMKKLGMRTKGFYYIPLVGGAAVPEEDFPDRKTEVLVAFAGPVFGLALSGIAAVAYYTTANPMLAAVAAWMALMNLFNLLPVNPLDGGRVFKSVAFSIRTEAGYVFLFLGIVAAGLLAYKFNISIFYILLIVGVLDLIGERTKVMEARTLQATADVFKGEKRENFIFENRALLKKANRMEKNDVTYAVVSYVALSAVLYGIMQVMISVPGADVAMQVLKG